MTDHRIVTPELWVEARKQLLAKEKEFTKLRDQLSQARRDLPWVADTAFTQGDDFCSVWHLFNLIPEGAAGWQPRFRYAI
jgi:predicted dithiol-disulfide oxidoreductase (DUF899 family)